MAAHDDVLRGKYPAKQHAKRVVDYIRSTVPDTHGILYLESAATRMLEDNDEAAPFRLVLPRAPRPRRGTGNGTCPRVSV